MVTRKALENLYAAYYAATAHIRAEKGEGWVNALHEDFGHELSAWDAWYDNGADPYERPDEWQPTMASLNAALKEHGIKAIGGKKPRVVKL